MVKFPSLRRWLVEVHQDLFLLLSKVGGYEMYEPLTTVELMILLLEDRRFFGHHGVDYRSCARELFRALLFTSHGGASTIDMQFVRTITGYKKYALSRKIYEMTLSLLIQFKLDKIEILRAYLAHAFFGSHLIGIECASRKVFSKHSFELSVQEAAELASMLVYPKPQRENSLWRANIERRSKYAVILFARREEILKQLPG